MAGLEPLIPYIYHEKQQAGSMLCAQHALNSLLQGSYFTAPDLSDLARSLDILEESYDHSNTGATSTNMDDTGFFSVQVLDNALKVWGLNLTRWRSETMIPYHSHPQTQLAFILNLEQHWFVLRRFGSANPNVDLDDGNGHWFNLNSFLSTPEWVGKTYLGMVIQQAEAEGYSVFAVTQALPDEPLALPRTEADEISATLPEPTSASVSRIQRPFGGNFREVAASGSVDGTSNDIDLEDEDYELQAALQASLMGQESAEQSELGSSTSLLLPNISTFSSVDLSRQQHSPTGSDSGPHTPQFEQPQNPSILFPGHADVDPVTASMERNRVLLQRMRQQQEFAQREMWSESELTPEEQQALEERREHRRRQEEEEEEELRRAIEESEALARQQLQLRAGDQASTTQSGGFSSSGNHPMLDGDDARLQAALEASLEYADFASPKASDADDVESIVSESTDIVPDLPTEAPSVDEIRKRRLAKFGM